MEGRMLKNFKRGMVIVGAAILVVGFFVIANNNYVQQRQQGELLARFNNIDASSLASAELVPGHAPPLAGEVCLTIEDPAALKELAALFSRADAMDFGGHQSSRFRFRLRLGVADGAGEEYLIRAYERFPDDIFLNLYRYEIYDGGSYSYTVVPQIHIPGLYPWLRERVVQAGCAVDR